MSKTILTLLLVIALALALFCAPISAVEVQLASGVVPTGATVQITGSGAVNAAIVIQVSGPGVNSGVNERSDGRGRFQYELGPFTQPGEYLITVSDGRGRRQERLEVRAPVHQATVSPGALGQEAMSTLDAIENSIGQVESGLAAYAGNDPDLKKAGELLRQARSDLPEIRRSVQEFARSEKIFAQTLLIEPNLDPEAIKEYETDVKTSQASLREESERLIAQGREMSGGRTDACVAMAVASTVLNAEQVLLRVMQNSLKTYIQYWARWATLGSLASAMGWIQNRFLRGMNSLFQESPEQQVLNRTGPAAPARPPLFSPYQAGLNGFRYLEAAVEGGPWAAAGRALKDAVDWGIERYTLTHCQTFRGTMSGHTHVEALDNKRPMYQLDNDWEGTVRITSAIPSGREAVSFRGFIVGRAKNFRVQNGLRILYEGKPGNFQYLTGAPSALQQLGAVFVTLLEGTIEGDRVVLKARRGGVDFDNRLIAKLAVVVIPSGSPVPLVQKYDTPYQGGAWQVTRALGEGGMIQLTITQEEDQRWIRKSATRSLENAGARGTFSLTIKLCAGCPQGLFE